MHFEQRNVYVQCVLLTYVPFGIAVCVKAPVATAGDAYELLAVSMALLLESFVQLERTQSF